MAKKYKLLALVVVFTALYGILIKAAISPPLPSPNNPLILYSNQNRDDFRLVLKKCFAHATQSIHVWMYAVTDSLLLHQLQKKATQGIKISVHYDKKGGTQTLPASLHPQAVKCKGLMHRKIVVIDDATVFIGSANMTTPSLQLHDNLTVGIYNPEMAAFLQSPTSNTFRFREGLLWLLPDKNGALEIEHKLDAATSSIFIAMFTFTHNKLVDALIRAKERGVDVKLAIDRYTARGASKKAIQRLSQANIEIFYSSGLPLLHHKWAYIDEKELILGSTNWTESAFNKNQDVLLFLNHLPTHFQSQIDSIISAIQMESNRDI